MWESEFDPGKYHTLYNLALAAYIYGYSLVITETTKKIMLTSGHQLNEFFNKRFFPTPEYSTIVRPNVDTLYSMAWLNLSEEPMVLSLPNTHNKYYLMELLDSWTNVFSSLGARTTGTRASLFVIAGPDWNQPLPNGMIRIDAPTRDVWIIGRTQTNGKNDYHTVHEIQDNYLLVPLSCWPPAKTHHKNTHQKKIRVNPVDKVASMDAASFFTLMMQQMYVNPPWVEDPLMDTTLRQLELIPSKSFNYQSLSSASKQALSAASQYGPQFIKAAAEGNYANYNDNGWFFLTSGIGFYGANYLLRAIIAMTGIGANLPKDSIYASAFIDKEGFPLVGFNDYMIHFNQEQFPPVNAFWSITVYNSRGYLTENSIDRYTLSPHLNNLLYNIDGSLDIFIGNSPPENDYYSNWLPTPIDEFNLIMRMYWPKHALLAGTWKPPPVIRI